MNFRFVVFSTFVVACLAQRSPYAGQRPIGFPTLEPSTADPLGNRFAADAVTEPLPIEALGDRDLVNRLAKLPIDKQPFWYLNWKALEQQRKNQQTYDLKPNSFIENPSSNIQNQVQTNQQPNQMMPIKQKFPPKRNFQTKQDTRAQVGL